MVKNKKLSKSSVAIIVLALLLVASLVMGMTGAWFTDSVSKVENGLKFGTVKLTLGVEDNWNIVTGEGTEPNRHPYLGSTDMMPGDTLVGDFHLQNEGDPAYVFMVYGGEVIRGLAGMTAQEKLAIAEALWVAADHEDTAWADAEQADKDAAVAALTDVNTAEYRAAHYQRDLFELLDQAAEAAAEAAWVAADHDNVAWADATAEQKAAAKAAVGYLTLPQGATVLSGYTVDGKAVSYYTLERYDATAVTDEKEALFRVVLAGDVFGNEYQGAEINIGVEFVAVQVANLEPAAALRAGFAANRIEVA